VQSWVRPEIPDPDSVWDYVSFGTEFHIERNRRRDGRAYASVECGCAWEREHGLQVVFRDGRTVSKVGPFDGHLTNGDEFGDNAFETLVHISPFAL
jgi:hypothetical protein